MVSQAEVRTAWAPRLQLAGLRVQAFTVGASLTLLVSVWTDLSLQLVLESWYRNNVFGVRKYHTGRCRLPGSASSKQ